MPTHSLLACGVCTQQRVITAQQNMSMNVHSSTHNKKIKQNTIYKLEAKDVLLNINCTQAVERVENLDLQTRPSEGPNTSLVWIWRKSVHVPEIFHTQTNPTDWWHQKQNLPQFTACSNYKVTRSNTNSVVCTKPQTINYPPLHSDKFRNYRFLSLQNMQAKHLLFTRNTQSHRKLGIQWVQACTR